jgi:hypothetical protein
VDESIYITTESPGEPLSQVSTCVWHASSGLHAGT